MHELGAELERHGQVRLVARQDAAADAVARLEHADVATAARKLRRSGQAGGACADDGDVECFAGFSHSSTKVERHCVLGQTTARGSLRNSCRSSTDVDVRYLRV